MPDTAATECGLWRTPTADDASNVNPKGNRFGSLVSQLNKTLIPTPTVGDAKSSGSRNTPNSKAHAGVSLTDFVKQDGGTGRMLPTPTAQDYGNNKSSSPNASVPPSLSQIARLFPTPTANEDAAGRPGAKMQPMLGNHPDVKPPGSLGSLNPQWVEWLMGYPHEHTALKASATPSCRKSRKSSATSSRKSKGTK